MIVKNISLIPPRADPDPCHSYHPIDIALTVSISQSATSALAAIEATIIANDSYS